jgi:hypothetical protein
MGGPTDARGQEAIARLLYEQDLEDNRRAATYAMERGPRGSSEEIVDEALLAELNEQARALLELRLAETAEGP